MNALIQSNIGSLPGIDLSMLINILPLIFLSSIRVGAFIMSAPLFGMYGIPLQVRIIMSFILGLGVINYSGLPNADLLNNSNYILIILTEIAVGLTAGFIVTIIFSSVALAGEKIATSAGLGYAAQIDPIAGGQTPVVSQTLNLFLLVLFISLDAHLIMLRIFLESFIILPIGANPPFDILIGSGIKAAGSMFIAASLIMLPVTGTILMINIAAGIMTKSAPQLNLFSFVFPVTMLSCFIILYFSTGAMSLAFSDLIFSAIDSMEMMLMELTSG